MAKTAEELQALKEKVEELKKELSELTEEELRQVSGGFKSGWDETWGDHGYFGH